MGPTEIHGEEEEAVVMCITPFDSAHEMDGERTKMRQRRKVDDLGNMSFEDDEVTGVLVPSAAKEPPFEPLQWSLQGLLLRRVLGSIQQSA